MRSSTTELAINRSLLIDSFEKQIVKAKKTKNV